MSRGFRATPVALFAGEARIGTDGKATIVVKRRVAVNALVPPAFVALTRQKNVVLLASPLTAREVAVIPWESTTVVEKLRLMESWRRYVDAPADAFQLSVGFVDTPVALSAGDASVGVVGAEPGNVVN